MKSINLFMLLSLFSASLFAQSRTIENLFEKYDDEALSIDINIPAWLKNGAASQVSHRGTKTAIRKAKRFKLIKMDDHFGWRSDMRSAKKALSRDNYDELITVRDDGEISLFVSEGRDDMGLRELVFFINGDDDGLLLSLKGNFDKRDIEEILDDIHIECN